MPPVCICTSFGLCASRSHERRICIPCICVILIVFVSPLLAIYSIVFTSVTALSYSLLYDFSRASKGFRAFISQSEALTSPLSRLCIWFINSEFSEYPLCICATLIGLRICINPFDSIPLFSLAFPSSSIIFSLDSETVIASSLESILLASRTVSYICFIMIYISSASARVRVLLIFLFTKLLRRAITNSLKSLENSSLSKVDSVSLLEINSSMVFDIFPSASPAFVLLSRVTASVIILQASRKPLLRQSGITKDLSFGRSAICVNFF